MSNQNEILDVTQLTEESAGLEAALRPTTLDEFIGQEKLKENLRIFIAAAKSRKEALDHCLFYAPPGLGKTTLANILAKELGVNIKTTSGPVLARPGDLAAMLTTELAEGDILFIDEIHRLNPAVEEALYPAMEDFTFFINTGKGAGSTTLKLAVPQKKLPTYWHARPNCWILPRNGKALWNWPNAPAELHVLLTGCCAARVILPK